jgi:O-antigen ligase
MKLSGSKIVIPLLCFYLVVGIYFLDSSLESLLRIFRLMTVPVLIFIIFALTPKIRLLHVKHLSFLGLPIVILFIINFIQLIVLPKGIVETHLTGSIKFAAWFCTYLCSLLTLYPSSVLQYKKYILNILFIIFLFGVAIYPFIMISSGVSLSTVLAGYGDSEDRIQTSGFFGSSNEDANGLMTLFPIALIFLEKMKGPKKTILKLALFAFFPFLLLYNGTRTTLFFTLPIILVVFYSKLSLKGLIRLALMFAAPIGFALPFATNFMNKAFASQSSGSGGSFSWRVDHVWTPAIEYTQKYSPIFGFGSRGWEYVAQQLGLFKDFGGQAVGEIISPHSGYVWAFVCWGGLGLAAYVLFLVTLLAESFRLSQLRDPELSLLGRALFCSVFGYISWAYISNVMWAQGWVILVSIATLIATTKMISLMALKSRMLS